MRFLKINPVNLPVGRAKYRSYSQEAMTNAYLAVLEENVSIRRAAKSCAVLYQTLRDRVAGDVDPERCTMGGQPLLSLDEESKLVNHLKEMAMLGYGYSRQEVANIATSYCIDQGKKTQSDPPLSMNWFYGFMGRWPDLKVVKPRALEIARAKAANETNVRKYFIELEKTLDKYQLKDQPHLIYNVDEKGVTINHRPPNVVSGVEVPPQEVTSGKGQTVTLLGCGNAVGNNIPPYFVFPGKRMVDGLLEGASPGVDRTVSESGWSNGDIFLNWLKSHFSKYIPRGQKVLLLLDGHKSHVSLDVIEWAKANDVILQLLPAHTSHILQPLDVGCYGPLQKVYDNLCHKLMRTKECVIARYDICSLACKAYSIAVSASNLQSAFKKTGIYPFNIDIIKDLPLKPSEVFSVDDTNVERVEGPETAVVGERVEVVEERIEDVRSEGERTEPVEIVDGRLERDEMVGERTDISESSGGIHEISQAGESDIESVVEYDDFFARRKNVVFASCLPLQSLERV